MSSHPVLSFLRKRLIAGLIILVPLVFTVWATQLLFRWSDGILAPLWRQALGHHYPGLGILSVLILVLLLGMVGSNLLGQRLISLVDRLLLRIPGASWVYSGSKQLIGAISPQQRAQFRGVVLVEWPRPNQFRLGLVTRERVGVFEGPPEDELVNVFLPHTPNPAGGFLMLMPRRSLLPIDMNVDQAIKYVVAGGLIGPDNIRVPREWIERLRSRPDRFSAEPIESVEVKT
ncbi:MAG TPA: DUF502 domain-containing protein [Acidobacteriota bacterium]|jgi:uncharacterized membrane protein